MRCENKCSAIRDVHGYYNLFAQKAIEDNSKLRMICLSITSIYSFVKDTGSGEALHAYDGTEVLFVERCR